MGDDKVYQPPKGFWLNPTDYSQQLYGAISREANWSVGQWNIPEDLPAFRGNISTNRWATVRWIDDGQRYQLAQDGTTISCNKRYPSGRKLANEFDLFVGPNNANTPRFPQALIDNDKVLSRIRRATARIRLEIRRADAVDEICPVTRSSFLYAVVLTNRKHKQVLFYQIRLSVLEGTRGTLTRSLMPAWFFAGVNGQSGATGQWGFGDNVTSYAQPWASKGNPQAYSLDLLPRLRQIINLGAAQGLDQSLDDWRLTGTYHGQAAWGHVRNDAIWDGFALEAE